MEALAYTGLVVVSVAHVGAEYVDQRTHKWCQARTWAALIIMALADAAAMMMSDRDSPETEASKSFPGLSDSFPTQVPAPAGMKE